MRGFIWVYACITFYVTSAAIACSNIFDYHYAVIDSYYGHSRPLWNRPYRCFNCPRSFPTRRYVEKETITCSNVSSTISMNYTYQPAAYRQDLVIVNSVIPVLPSNSSLSRFTAINKLSLKDLSIKEISAGALDGFNILKILDLNSNKITKLPDGVFANLSFLTLLDLSKNSINNIERESFSGLVNLDELYLNQNKLSSLRDGLFKDLIKLKKIDVSDNPLKEFQDVGFYQLKELTARNTHLKNFDLDLSKSPSLVKLDLSEGCLEKFDFANLPALNYLKLSNNSISTALNWNKLNARVVFLNNNNLTELGEIPQNVISLDLSHNLIKTLRVMNHLSNQNKSLSSLNLNFNDISEINTGVFWGLKNLNSLFLQHNNLTILHENTFVNCTNLQSVDFSHNQIEHFESNVFKSSPLLVRLNISNNNLITLNYEMLPNLNQLTQLYFNNNEVARLDAQNLLYHFDGLKSIAINHNSWFCEDLSDIFHYLKIKNIAVIDADSLDADHANGIECIFYKKS